MAEAIEEALSLSTAELANQTSLPVSAPESCPDYHVERQVGRVVLNDEVFLTVDRQTQDHLRTSPIGSKSS